MQPCHTKPESNWYRAFGVSRCMGSSGTFEREQIAPGAVKHSGRYLFLVLGGSLLARGLRYRAKLKNILGDFGNRPRFWSCLQ
jgi:hypothetical protein